MTNAPTTSFAQKCIQETVAGIRKGLTQFSGKSKVAVIYCLEPGSQLQIYDPENLLKVYDIQLKRFYIDSDIWRTTPVSADPCKAYKDIIFDSTLRLDGLFCCGGSSSPVSHQMWFTNRKPDICSPAPFISWLLHAILRFSHDMANQEHLYTGVSGRFLREYTNSAVHNAIHSSLNIDSSCPLPFNLHDVLESVLEISRTHEEGLLPFGKLVFTNGSALNDSSINIKFTTEEQPQLRHFKHVRKLLQAVEKTSYSLVSNGFSIHGLSDKVLPLPNITADFQGRSGFLAANDIPICSFTDGMFFSSTHQDKLFELEELLLDYSPNIGVHQQLFKTISSIVHTAQRKKFGCSLIIDLSNEVLQTSGQHLEQSIDLKSANQIELAGNLAKVDGAIHICKDNHLHGFACLLDGKSIASEDRSRGARYNSALRFSFENQDTILIVVSSDRRPVAIIYRGMELSSTCFLPETSTSQAESKLLTEWLSC